jgi:hypothetical protein
MATMAVIDGTNVVNIIVADPYFTLPDFTLVEIPDGVTAGPGYTYDGESFSPPVVPLEDLRATKSSSVDTKRDAILLGGFTVPSEVSTALAGRVLQTRNETDRTAWLTSQAAYQAAVLNGQGATEGATFRPEDNITTTVSYAEGLNILLAMAAWGAAIYGRSWDLKDAIADAADSAALDAIDIESGWPG